MLFKKNISYFRIGTQKKDLNCFSFFVFSPTKPTQSAGNEWVVDHRGHSPQQIFRRGNSRNRMMLIQELTEKLDLQPQVLSTLGLWPTSNTLLIRFCV